MEGYLLSLAIGGGFLLLPQLDMLDFVDFLWDALPFLKSGREWGNGEVNWWRGET